MNSNKRRKRAQVKEEVELDFELCSIDKFEFFKSLRDLYISRSLCDIVFEVNDGVQFEAHRVVLAASNGFLGALILNGMKENDQRTFFIKDDGVLFKLCLDFLYGLPIRIDSSQIIPLLGLANSYSMISLRDQLADRLEANLTVENCCSIFAAADMYGCHQLREQALNRLFNNFALASKTPAFYDLPVALVIFVLSSSSILDCDEAVVFEAAAKWLEGNGGSTSHCSGTSAGTGSSGSGSPWRDTHSQTHAQAHATPDVRVQQLQSGKVLEVLRCVRYPLMDAGYLSDVIKGHPLMTAPERANLLMEAFEHHALRAAGRPCSESLRTRPRKQSCSFSQSTLLNGHQDSVSALVTTGDWLLSGSWDTSIKVWSTESWLCVRTLSDHTDSIRGLCVCSDKVVSCSDDGSIKVWTPGSWTCVRSLEGHEGAVNAVVLCGARLASAGDDGVINLWNTGSWSCEVTVHHGAADSDVEGNDGEGNGNGSRTVGVMSLEVVGQGARMRLVSGSDDAAIKIWNTSSWTCEHVLRAHQDEIWAMRWTSEGTLVTGSVDGTIRSWRCMHGGQDGDGAQLDADWVCESVVSSSAGPVYAVICLEGRVVTAGAGNRIAVWGADWTLHRWFDTTEAGVWALTVCKGRLVSGGVDGTLRVWT